MAYYQKYVKWIPYDRKYIRKYPRLFYNNVHYCSWCGIEMPKEKYHGNKIFCKRCETRWKTGNNNDSRYVVRYRDQSYETYGGEDATTRNI